MNTVSGISGITAGIFLPLLESILCFLAGGGRMEKQELYKLSHNLWKSKMLIEKAYDLTLKTIENEKNMPFLEVALEEIMTGLLANLGNKEK